MHFNIQGLENKCDMLNIDLSTHKIDILCLSEHWLKQNELQSTAIVNYKLVNYYTRIKMQRGGVCIFAKNDIDIEPLEYDCCIEKHFEICIGVIRSMKGGKVYIIAVYRTPDSNFTEFINRLEILFHKIYNKKHSYILAGDVNVNFLENCSEKRSLINFFSSYNMIHHIDCATRITRYSNTCIDNIFSNCLMNNVEVLHSYLSDHTYQVCKFSMAVNEQNNSNCVYRRNFNDSNLKTFQNLIAKENWQEIYDANGFNTKFEIFNSTFTYYFNCAFPITKIKMKNTNKKWFTPRIKSLHDQLCEMEKLEKQLQNPIYTARYKEFKILYKLIVNDYKTKINDDRIACADNVMKESWKIINECNKRDGEKGSFCLSKNNQLITNPIDVANLFNDYFTNQNKSCPKPNPDNIKVKNHLHSFYLLPTNAEEIERIINKTTAKSAAGIDGINGKVLRLVGHLISTVLSYLINESFSEGIYPDVLKTSKCIPVYKNKGTKQDVANYRLIHLQSQLAKIFELAYCNRLTNFVETANLLNAVQNGFRKNKSTTTAIHELVEMVYEALNNKTHTVALFYDLSRAFDTVDHKLLLNKLYGVGIRGVAHNWATSYLSSRSQNVVVEGIKSVSANIELGVPQGSILGPLFFIIFINDLTDYCIASDKTILYADDTNFLMRHNNIETLAQNCNTASKQLDDWCNNNGLVLNINKTFHMKFYTKNITPDYNMLIKLCSKSISSADNIKFLGLTIDHKLTWEIHINNVCSKLSNICYIIRTLRETVSITILKTLYYGLVQSTLQYSLIFWGSSAYLERAFVIQKKILRCMVNAHPLTSCKAIFKKLNILTLPCLYISQLILHIRANENNFVRNHEIHSHNTRSNQLMRQPFSRLDIGQKSPNYIGIKCYNKIKASHPSLRLRYSQRGAGSTGSHSPRPWGK